MLLASIGLLSGRAATAERTDPIRIGALTAAWGPTPQIIGLRDGLVALGYREHEQFAIGVRFTRGAPAALPAAARALVQDGVDLLFVGGDNDAAHAAQQATTSIPIVFAGVSNLLGAGLIQSFAQPGRNITGVTDLDLELAPKRLQVFQEMLPGLQRLLFLYDATGRPHTLGADDPARSLISGQQAHSLTLPAPSHAPQDEGSSMVEAWADARRR
jgi:putative ABC transport system substrate-binding protein